jgi:hypothetical protein
MSFFDLEVMMSGTIVCHMMKTMDSEELYLEFRTTCLVWTDWFLADISFRTDQSQREKAIQNLQEQAEREVSAFSASSH